MIDILTPLVGYFFIILMYYHANNHRKEYVKELSEKEMISKSDEHALHGILTGEYMFLLLLIVISIFCLVKYLLTI